MLRSLSRFLRWVIMGTGFVLVLFCICFAVMQTKWAKEKMRALLVRQCEDNGIQAEIEGLDGRLPFSWTIDRVELHLPQEQMLVMSQCKVRLSVFPLFRGAVTIDYLNVGEADYAFTEAPRSPSDGTEQFKCEIKEKIQDLSPVLHLSVHSLKIGRLTIRNLTNQTSYAFSLSAKGKWRRDNTEFFFNGKLSPPGNAQVYAELFLNGLKSKGEISAGFKAHIERVDALKTFYAFPFDGDLLVESTVTGPWDTWEALFWEGTHPGAPLSGKLIGRVRDLHVPAYPLLDRNWRARTHFSLQAEEPIKIDHIQILSDLIRLKGKGEIGSDWKSSIADFEFQIPELDYFSPEVRGKLAGKAFYGAEHLNCSFSSEHLSVHSYEWGGVRGIVEADRNFTLWQGAANLSAETGILPFESTLKFTWDPDAYLKLTDIAVKTEDGALNGDLAVSIPSHLLDGALYVKATRIENLTPFINHIDIEGGLGAEVILWNEEQKQNVRLEILAKNIRYSDYSIVEMSASTEARDLYNLPYGNLSLTADKIYSPQFFMNQLTFRTYSEKGQRLFSLNGSGAIQDPFEMTVNGSWEQTGPLFQLGLSEMNGVFAKKMFHLEQPCTLTWGPAHLEVSACALAVGDGSFQGSCDFSETRSDARFEMKHFPLSVLSILRPRFSLDGSATASGFLNATPENISGALNAVLEESGISYFGKEDPLHAKGSIQLHLENKMLQAHCFFRANKDQFADLTASVPVRYSLYPFTLALETQERMSGELIAEGKVEEIFDFINVSSHNISGLLSCRLFLSQTPASPALQGMIDWENGIYENYYTGTALKDIQVHVEAERDQLKLISLTASDEQGSIAAEGKLQLKPQEKFPYEISAELHNLNALQFDMIDCYFTGPLYLTGTTGSALVQGNLNVPKANIKIPDQLPYNIPNLPVTFINRHPHLAGPQVAPLPVFPFHIDLELTAESDVFVEGKGLKSEWEGAVHLSGTNMTVAASGKLDLIKGEYYFTGKLFKLNEGQIVFNDKPTPSAYLNLSGILSLRNAEIIAILKGPLTSPQLTFQSNPHMTTSAILASILFNKDIGDINQIEALQLATTLMDLSGGATPNVMETIRKTLGIDRLTIAPTEKNDIALQIGKYLTKGVMITLSQSATSSQVIVEVELKKGFVFQAETQEEQEGKFSLKWRRNY